MFLVLSWFQTLKSLSEQGCQQGRSHAAGGGGKGEQQGGGQGAGGGLAAGGGQGAGGGLAAGGGQGAGGAQQPREPRRRSARDSRHFSLPTGCVFSYLGLEICTTLQTYSTRFRSDQGVSRNISSLWIYLCYYPNLSILKINCKKKGWSYQACLPTDWKVKVSPQSLSRNHSNNNVLVVWQQ